MATGQPEARRLLPGGGPAGWRRALGQAGWALLLALGFLVGRAPVLGALGPFPIALVAALRGAGLPAGLAVAGALAGLLSRAGAPGLPWASAFSGALGVAVVLLWPVRRVAVSAAAMGAAGLAALPQAGASPLDWFGAGLQAAVTGALAQVLARGAAAVAERPGALDPEGALAGLLVAMGAVAGLEGTGIWQGATLWLPADALVASVAVMAAAWAAGPLAGSAAGLLVGLAGLVASGQGDHLARHASSALAFGVAGLLAGAFRELGRPGVVLAYVSLHLFLRARVGDMTPDTLWGHTAAVVLAALCLFAVPRRWAVAAGSWVLAGLPAATLPAAGRAPEDRGAASGPAEKAAALARVLREVQQALQRPDRPEAEPAPAAVQAEVVGQVVTRLCEDCRCHGYCWGRGRDNSLAAFSDLWRRLERDGSVSVADIPEEKLKCIHPQHLVQALNHGWDRLAQERRHRLQVAQTRLLLGEQVQNLVRVMEHLAQELRAGGGDVHLPPVRLAARVGASRLAKRNSLVSGDSYLTAPLGPGRLLVALSDGMGAGREAARESERALAMLHGLLAAGFRPELAVQTTNLALMLRPAGDWFATLDAAVVDLCSGRTAFLKLGAAPALIKRGRHVQVVRVEAPPAGILPDLSPELELRVLRPGDWLVLVSDGLWDRGVHEAGDGRWLVDFLSSHEPRGPGALAEALLARALAGGPAEPGDDMTAVVVQVEAAGVAAGGPGPREPVPARWAAARAGGRRG